MTMKDDGDDDDDYSLAADWNGLQHHHGPTRTRPQWFLRGRSLAVATCLPRRDHTAGGSRITGSTTNGLW